MTRIRLALALALLSTLILDGCGSLELQTRTVKVSGERYLRYSPWMHYTVQGSGRPIVLIHDLLTDSWTWRRNVAELSESFQVFTVDLPGYGGSINPFEAYTLEFFSSTIGMFLRQMSMGDAVLVGHGMGAAVALDCYLRYPEMVKSVVVINATGFDEPDKQLAQDIERIGVALYNSRKEADLERLRKEVLEASFANLYAEKKLVNKELVDHYMSWLEKPGGREALLGTLRFFKTDGLMQRLIAAETDLMTTRKMDRRGERNVLIIWGTEDAWYPPKTAEYFRARIPNSKVAIIKGAGHFPHEEQPAKINGLLLDALLTRPVPANAHLVAKYDASSLLEEGRTLKRRGKFDEAQEKFKAAIELNPYLGVAYYEIGDILFEQQKFAESIEMLNESLRIYPHNAQVRYRLATTFHNQATTMAKKWAENGMDASFIADNTASMIEKAIEQYEMAGKLDPRMPNPWFNLGRLYEQAGDYNEVARVYGRLFDTDSTNLRAANLYVNALLKTKNAEGAVEAIQRVEEIKSEKEKASWPAWRGKLLLEQGRWDQAITAWRRASDLEPANPVFHGYLAMCLANNGKLPEAKESVAIALSGDAANPEWHRLAGRLALHEQQWEKAALEFQTALRALPDNSEALAGLTIAQLRLGKGEEMARMLDQALVKLGDQPELLVARARVHALAVATADKDPLRRQQEKQAALALLQRASAKGYDCSGLAAEVDFAPLKDEAEFRALKRKILR
ncbi:MAG: alpha/beta fold hydrolase [Deltaproteobacteria bacterium]|nr:alpha/beta fold hydrolase [Deltaproteobacteria bacterium]